MASFPQVSPPTPCAHLYPPPYAPHALPISVFTSRIINCRIIFRCSIFVRRGADKSLARPGRKQATATKLGIYLTYYPRSSIHFLARCSNFCKQLKKKKKFRRLSVPPGLCGNNDLSGPDRPRPTTLLPPRSNGKTEAATAVYKLLIMGMRMPETCWAVFKQRAINLRDWCIWFVDLFECMLMHGLANPKFTILLFRK